jgi:deoxyribodipyrimidine photolyase-related protein
MIIRLVLGDQLNIEHSWYKQEHQENYVYVMMELTPEVKQPYMHIQKVIGFFAAMRHFAATLTQRGATVKYFKLNDTDNQQNLLANISQVIQEFDASLLEYQLPDQWQLYQTLKGSSSILGIPVKHYDSEHFYASITQIAAWGAESKYRLMEHFYRMMRREHNILMSGKKPLGDKWNFDGDNRKKWKGEPPIPHPYSADNMINDLVAELQTANLVTIGSITADTFIYPIHREQALAQLQHFLTHNLAYFGSYQDAMHTEHTLLFHTNLSFAINSKLLSPKEVVDAAIAHYHNHSDQIDLAQIEGFVRQIIGWREYMRMMYWNHYEQFKQSNFFDHHASLPEVYWTGQSNMNCIRQCAQNSLSNAYAHHIQRLMILGNFALMMQTDPQEVDAWYLGVYIDALEWVQLPNTHGMSQFADGGLIATKPYIASASYVQKMSNYCQSCSYDPTTKTEENSCPLNSLYWNFLYKNREKLSTNPRMGLMFSLLDKISEPTLTAMVDRANHLIKIRNL